MSIERPIYCSFCGKNSKDVFLTIAGPTVFICDECVDMCQEMVDQKRITIFKGADIAEAEYRSWFPGKYLP